MISIVVGLPLAQVMRHKPEDYGEYVDGVPPEKDAPLPPTPVATLNRPERDFTLKEAMRTPAFWLISFGHGSALLVVGAVSVHVISHLNEDLGYSVGAASLVVTLMTVFQVLGMVAGGALGDRIEKRKIAATCMFMHMVGLLLVAYATNIGMVVAFAALHGFAWGARGPLDAGDTGRLLRAQRLRRHHGRLDDDLRVGPDCRPAARGHHGGRDRRLRDGLHGAGRAGGLGSGFFIFARRPVPPGTLTYTAERVGANLTP